MANDQSKGGSFYLQSKVSVVRREGVGVEGINRKGGSFYPQSKIGDSMGGWGPKWLAAQRAHNGQPNQVLGRELNFKYKYFYFVNYLILFILGCESKGKNRSRDSISSKETGLTEIQGGGGGGACNINNVTNLWGCKANQLLSDRLIYLFVSWFLID